MKAIQSLRNPGGADCETLIAACLAAAEALELAYGLIWHVPVDKVTEAGRCASMARLALLAQLDRAAQGRGIEAARKLILEARKRKPGR